MQNSYLTKKQIIDLLDINKDQLELLLNDSKTNEDLTIFDLNQLVSRRNSHYNFSAQAPKQRKNKVQKKNGLNVLDLYSGAGGLSCGFSQAGFSISGSVELNKIYSKTHDYNFPSSKSLNKNISDIKINDFKNLIGEKIHVIIGGPPCQTFSSLGKGKLKSLGKNVLKDIRTFEYQNFISYVKIFNPDAFLMENVPGFMTQNQGRIFEDFVQQFEGTDYKLSYKIISTADYGVPQFRKRLFVIGIKSDTFQFPHTTHTDKNNSNLFNEHKAHYVSVKDSLSDLPDINDNWRISKMPYKQNNQLSDYQRRIRNGSNFVYNNICRLSNDDAKEMFKYLKPNQRLSEISQSDFKKLEFSKLFKSRIIYNRCRRLPLNTPSWTIVAHIGIDGYEYIHPKLNRTLSVREAARLQSFPDNFIFFGNMREQYLQVGNAVPPIVGKHLANAIYNSLH
jgi:DNA (cytosine-5)-methyltransferase 1